MQGAGAPEGGEHKWPPRGNFLEPNSSDPIQSLISRPKQRNKRSLTFSAYQLAKCFELLCQKFEGSAGYPNPLDSYLVSLNLEKAALVKKELVKCCLWISGSKYSHFPLLQGANTFTYLEGEAYGNCDRMCFPILRSSFSLHLSPAVLRATRGPEGRPARRHEGPENRVPGPGGMGQPFENLGVFKCVFAFLTSLPSDYVSV